MRKILVAVIGLIPLAAWSQIPGGATTMPASAPAANRGGATISAPATTASSPRDNTSFHAANLKLIGQAMFIYAAEYNDRVPPNMELLLKGLGQYSTSTEVPPLQRLAGPDVTIPPEIGKAPLAEQAAWLAKNGGYVVLGLGQRFSSVRNTAQTPLAIERPDVDPTKPRLSVLYFDGHVEVRDRTEVEALIPKPESTTKP
jgi:prepilin-type processing-associated H-X9-DG protein